jgi:phenylalanyl-tRNA synthetase alpha chain
MTGQRGPVPVLHTEGNRDLNKEVLEVLGAQPVFKTEEKFPDVGQIEIKATLDRLASRSMIEYETEDSQVVLLTEEGEAISKEGSHEFKVR